MRFYALILVGLVISCATEGGTLKIAVASNMYEAIDSIASVFNEEKGQQCEIIAGPSGVLYEQLINGAPYDIFISADSEYNRKLQTKGVSVDDKFFVKGVLTWVFNTEPKGFVDQKPFPSNIEKIAVASPEVAPFGKVSMEYLSTLETFDEIEPRLVYGEGIDNVNGIILSKSVDAAITSTSFLANNEQYWDNYDPIDQQTYYISHYVSMIDHGQPHPAREIFYDFLSTKKSLNILEYFGYTVD